MPPAGIPQTNYPHSHALLIAGHMSVEIKPGFSTKPLELFACAGRLFIQMRTTIPFLALVFGSLTASLYAAQPYTIVDTAQTRRYDNHGEIAPPKPG